MSKNTKNRQDAILAVALGLKRLKELPSAKTEHKGKWKIEYQITTKTMFSNTKVTCSKCGYRKSRVDGEILNYCPNCGADMKGGDAE